MASVLGTLGPAGATISAVAAAAGLTTGLVHHHVTDKDALYGLVLEELRAQFQARRAASAGDPLDGYIDAALSLGARSDIIGARAWVGVFAEAVSREPLRAAVRRALDAEIATVERLSRGSLDTAGASAGVAFVVGALVLGAFAPRKTAGFAADSLRQMMVGLRRGRARAALSDQTPSR